MSFCFAKTEEMGSTCLLTGASVGITTCGYATPYESTLRRQHLLETSNPTSARWYISKFGSAGLRAVTIYNSLKPSMKKGIFQAYKPNRVPSSQSVASSGAGQYRL